MHLAKEICVRNKKKLSNHRCERTEIGTECKISVTYSTLAGICKNKYNWQKKEYLSDHKWKE